MFAEGLINKLLQRAGRKKVPFVIVYQIGNQVKVEANCRIDKIHQLSSVALDHCKKEMLKLQISAESKKAQDVEGDRKDN